jgi:hypothetical protein
MGIADDEVVALFVGRLSFHAKAHPHAMYLGLQAAAKSTGKKLVLIQCGWFANAAIEKAFREGAASACPDVRCLFTDGREEGPRMDSWAAGDIFISLSDNIQETFGLSPIEAMAAGLPVVVTDWDGYKDTVRDGVDGFRIPTWMAPAGTGAQLALAHESGAENYDMYCGLACQHVAVDHSVLAERLKTLVDDPALRQRLGQAGQQRAREAFDWAVLYRHYEDLWRELTAVREAPAQSLRCEAAPCVAPARLDPFEAFGHYPTWQLQPGTRVSLREPGAAGFFREVTKQPLFSYATRLMPPPDAVDRVWAALGSGPLDAGVLAREVGFPESTALRALALLAKTGALDLSK